MLALIGIIMMLESIGFIFFAEEITESMFPFAKNNPEALSLGISLRYVMASGVFFLGMLIFLCRGVPKSIAQRLLFCCGIGFSIVLLSLIYLNLFRDVSISIIIYALHIIIVISSYFVASRKFQV